MQIQEYDKYVLVTGCSSGIGKATAETLSQRGYRVIATVRKRADADALALSDSDLAVELDLANEDSVNSAVSDIQSFTNGQLYAIFNNGAYGQPGAVEDLTRTALENQFHANFFGTHQLTQLLIPELLKQKRAHIIQCSSILGLIGMPMRGAYVASKYALEGLSDTLRIELSETNIQVSLIEPGPIESNFRKNALVALQNNVDFTKSRHGWRYEAALKRLSSDKSTSKQALGPEAVVECVLHALESKRAKRRYYVTSVTKAMRVLKRIAPSAFIDQILLKYAKKE